MKLKAYGVRGSIPVSGEEFNEYGGNTTSYTLRTDDNTLIFLDAGTGIMNACNDLNETAANISLLISHAHADHIMGLGMSKLPWIEFSPSYKGKKVEIIGPEGILEGLRRFYDGDKVWPVRATNKDVEIAWDKPSTPSLNFAGLEEILTEDEIRIDSKTKLKTMYGNHGFDGGVLLYSFIEDSKKVVYATDNEFDYLSGDILNPNAEEFKEKYCDFIRNADILIADAQYTKEEYIEKKPINFHGFGHTYGEQIVDLASSANVKKLIITHFAPGKNDETLKQIENELREYILEREYNIELEFAKEGLIINI